MNTRIFICAVVMLLVCASGARANQEKLASAKNLYESASYEAALSELSAIDNTELVDEVDTYRALCLLGLGRARDAEQVLETVVTRKPLLTLSENDYSPRVVALFQSVRRKALPAAAQRLYSAARDDYDTKKYEAAAVGFKQALQVMADVAPESRTQTLEDLKELASGFLALAEAKAPASASPSAAAAPAPVPAPAASAPAATPPVASGSGSARAATRPAPAPRVPQVAPQVAAAKVGTYSLLDADVTAPVALEQTLPRWTFGAQLRTGVFTGTLELVVSETGVVESARVVETVWAPYDAALLEATKTWRYTPAMKDGKPVKFRRTLAINVDPRAR